MVRPSAWETTKTEQKLVALLSCLHQNCITSPFLAVFALNSFKEAFFAVIISIFPKPQFISVLTLSASLLLLFCILAYMLPIFEQVIP